MCFSFLIHLNLLCQYIPSLSRHLESANVLCKYTMPVLHVKISSKVNLLYRFHDPGNVHKTCVMSFFKSKILVQSNNNNFLSLLRQEGLKSATHYFISFLLCPQNHPHEAFAISSFSKVITCCALLKDKNEASEFKKKKSIIFYLPLF